MLKFKVDDIVEIEYNTCYHGFDIGEHVKITNITDCYYDCYYDGVSCFGNQEWSFTDSDCKAIKGVLQ